MTIDEFKADLANLTIERPTQLREDGHFPGCAYIGCQATRCADARIMRDYARSRR